MREFIKRSAVALAATVYFATSAAAVTISGEFGFGDNIFSPEIAAGDRFRFSLEIDEDVARSGTNPLRFDNSVTSFSLTADPDNTGTWTIGTFDIFPIKNFSVNTSGDLATIQLDGSGFGDLGGNPFHDLNFSFEFPFDVVGGDTLGDIGNGATVDFAAALNGISLRSRAGRFSFPRIDIDRSQIDLDGTSATPVPLPAGLWLMLGAVGALGFAARRRSRA
ncbi:MAG: VPLPA-CTERM sorting domain-containing protein [Pseudomonadota bacterium]